MKTTIRRSTAALVLAALVSLGTFLASDTARAQMNITVHNNTLCTVWLDLYDPMFVINSHLIPGGGGPTVITLPAGFVLRGARSAGGVFYPFLPPPPAIGCTPCIALRTPVPGVTCCGIVCYDSNIPVIFIHPCGNPPCPNP